MMLKGHFKAQVKTDQDYASINTALDNFITSDVAMGEIKYIPHGSTGLTKDGVIG